MRQELAGKGRVANFVAVNALGAESTQAMLSSRCNFDLLQDVAEVGAWQLMGGRKDDIFIFRKGGSLSPTGYFPAGGPIESDLSLPEGYINVINAVIDAMDAGPGKQCGSDPAGGGLQLPGDVNQDGSRNLTDAVHVLGILFQGAGDALPCEGDIASEGNRAVLDLNADESVDLTDAVHLLGFLFAGGRPPALAIECVRVIGCADACRE